MRSQARPPATQFPCWRLPGNRPHSMRTQASGDGRKACSMTARSIERPKGGVYEPRHSRFIALSFIWREGRSPWRLSCRASLMSACPLSPPLYLKPDSFAYLRSSAILMQTRQLPQSFQFRKSNLVGRRQVWSSSPNHVKLSPRVTVWRVEDVRALIVSV